MATSATGAAGLRYEVDTRASQFTVQAFASGMIAIVAHSPKIAIRDWAGEIRASSPALDDLSIRVRIRSKSLEVLDELRDDDRRELHRVMNKEVLESDRYPEVQFDSSEVISQKTATDQYRLSVQGKLKLHGITNDQSFVSQVSLGVDTARAQGSFTILQTDYDIRIASIAGGSLKLQDELKFYFYVVARKVQ
jgi:polyisoprenoid-binding protein YceI